MCAFFPPNMTMMKEKQKQIIYALITSPTRREACKITGISERTLYNYMQDEEFMKEYRTVIDGITKDTDARLKKAALIAVNHLISVVQDETAEESVRLKADRIILEHLTKKIECDNKYW